MSWQKPARIVVAIVGLVSAAGVYFALGERRVAPPSAPIESKVPGAVLEMTACVLKNFPGIAKNFEVACDSMAVNDDGTKTLTGNPLVITVHKAENRTFKVIGREAKVSKDQNQFEVLGQPVRLEDSDGFWLDTDRATVSRLDSLSRVEGPATFGKGRMTGSGVGFTYDDVKEVLQIRQQARMKTVDERGKLVTDLSSSTAVLDRLQHLLTLDTGVHVIRDDQVIDTDHAKGRLSPSNDIVTLIEMFGNSRVTGGASIDAMKARDITLDYTDDGKTLEASKLVGGASVSMKGDGEAAGRRIEGEVVDVTLAPDGTLTSAIARPAVGGNVRLDLPAGADTPARSITAQTLDGTGQPGKGLTHVIFTQGVLFSEALRSKPAAADKQSGMRTARSQRLEASLADDAVTTAVFSGGTTFEEAGLKACAAQADYNPQKGTLALSGVTNAGLLPMVAEEQVAMEGRTIEVDLDTRKMSARGDRTTPVTTFMQSTAAQRCKPSTPRPQSEQGARNVPRLLKSDVETTVVAQHGSTGAGPALEYDSQKGHAVYTGRATLQQEGTSIVADRLVLDQTKGDLTATGTAISSLLLDDKKTEGRAHEIRYVDEKRLLSFSAAPKTPNAEVSLVSGKDSTLRAGSIEVTLAASENKAEKMYARGNIRLFEAPHNVTGGATLEYTASDGRFVVKGDGRKAVVASTLEDGVCRTAEGNLLTFYKGKGGVEVEGGQKNARTEPAKSGTCTPPTPSTR